MLQEPCMVKRATKTLIKRELRLEALMRRDAGSMRKDDCEESGDRWYFYLSFPFTSCSSSADLTQPAIVNDTSQEAAFPPMQVAVNLRETFSLCVSATLELLLCYQADRQGGPHAVDAPIAIIWPTRIQKTTQVNWRDAESRNGSIVRADYLDKSRFSIVTASNAQTPR